jgi:hypothetical protein
MAISVPAPYHTLNKQTTDRRRRGRMAPMLYQDLPFDIQFEVAQHLGYLDVLRLAATSRYFHVNLHPDIVLTTQARIEFLKSRDKVAKNRERWACFTCYRMLPKEGFGNRMRAAKSGSRGERLTDEAARFCLDCARKDLQYDHLCGFRYGKVMYYFCHKCRRYQTKSTKCEKILENVDGNMVTRTICWQEGVVDMTNATAFLNRLPEHILKQVVTHLDYRDAIYLAQANRKMAAVVQPVPWVPIHRRYQFVQKKWKEATGNMDSNEPIADFLMLPCFACFRVKDKANRFTSTQLRFADSEPASRWKLRCKGCVQRLYHTPNNSAVREFRLQIMCQTCNVLRKKREPCRGCEGLFERGEIDRIPTPEDMWNIVNTDDFLDGIENLWSLEEDVGPSQDVVEDQEHTRLEKFQKRFWQGEMTHAEISLYDQIRQRIRGRRHHSFGGFQSFGEFLHQWRSNVRTSGQQTVAVE